MINRILTLHCLLNLLPRVNFAHYIVFPCNSLIALPFSYCMQCVFIVRNAELYDFAMLANISYYRSIPSARFPRLLTHYTQHLLDKFDIYYNECEQH